MGHLTVYIGPDRGEFVSLKYATEEARQCYVVLLNRCISMSYSQPNQVRR